MLDSSIGERRTRRTKRLPARYVHCTQDEGGNCHLLDILSAEIDSLDIECEESDFPLLANSLAQTEIAYAGAALTDPIDDPNEKDPQSVHEAQASTYWTYWLAAIYEELESLKQKGVYEEVDELPPNRKAVGSKWVLHIKRDQDGLIARFKARLVAKGFTQIPGQDFVYTFAPVARWESMRTILTLVAEHGMKLRQIDVKTAFLNGPLEEEIYMRRPSIAGPGYWKLKKGLYGLKQSGRQWYLELNSKLETIGFKRLESDWSVYIRTDGNNRSYVTTSVDDMLIASNTDEESDRVVDLIGSLFEITDNGQPTFHLGCAIERNLEKKTIRVHQSTYIQSILREFNFENCNPVYTPMDPKSRLVPQTATLTPEEADRVAKFPYTAVVGKCMYLSTPGQTSHTLFENWLVLCPTMDPPISPLLNTYYGI